MNRYKEILISIVTVVILLGFLFHEPFLMPMGIQMLLIVLASVLYLGLVAFLFKENPRDERERFHLFEAGRFSFLVGAVFLLLGIGWGISRHDVDSFLPITLIAMILSKILYRFYTEKRK